MASEGTDKRKGRICEDRREALAHRRSGNGLNLKNIGIIHNREFEEGVLRIEFYDETSSKKAAEILQKFRYIVYER